MEWCDAVVIKVVGAERRSLSGVTFYPAPVPGLRWEQLNVNPHCSEISEPAVGPFEYLICNETRRNHVCNLTKCVLFVHASHGLQYFMIFVCWQPGEMGICWSPDDQGEPLQPISTETVLHRGNPFFPSVTEDLDFRTLKRVGEANRSPTCLRTKRAINVHSYSHKCSACSGIKNYHLRSRKLCGHVLRRDWTSLKIERIGQVL